MLSSCVRGAPSGTKERAKPRSQEETPIRPTVMFKRRKEDGARARVPDRRNAQLRRFLEDAQNFGGVDEADVPDMRLHTTSGERVYLCAHGVLLFESEAEAAPGEPAPIDLGELAVTTTRAVFTGTKQIRQWAWPDLVRLEHAKLGPWTSISVSSRTRQFGVLYDDDHRDEIRFSIDLAIATAHGTREALIQRISAELSGTKTAHAG